MFVVITLLLFFTFIYSVMYKSRRHLHMLQQNLYNENNRYLKWVWKNNKEFLSYDLIVIGICILGSLSIFSIEKSGLFKSNIPIILQHFSVNDDPSL